MDGTPEAVKAMRGGMLTRLIIDDSVTLLMRNRDREITLRVDVAGRLEADGATTPFDPDTDPASLGCLVPLLFQRIADAGIEKDGTLSLTIGGTALIVPFDDHQISWSLTTSDGAQASCLAEGFVVWQ